MIKMLMRTVTVDVGEWRYSQLNDATEVVGEFEHSRLNSQALVHTRVEIDSVDTIHTV